VILKFNTLAVELMQISTNFLKGSNGIARVRTLDRIAYNLIDSPRKWVSIFGEACVYRQSRSKVQSDLTITGKSTSSYFNFF